MSFLLGWKVVERKEAVFGILADVSIRMITAKKSIFQKSAAFRICFPSSSSQPPPKGHVSTKPPVLRHQRTHSTDIFIVLFGLFRSVVVIVL
jgi:hypothetical protein